MNKHAVIVCNSGVDCLNVIDLDTYHIKHISLDYNNNHIGPHSISFYKDKIITVNSFSDDLSIIDINKFKCIKSIKVGPHPNDIAIINEDAYVLCGDSNSLNIIDLNTGLIKYIITLEEYPHNICISENKEYAYICNLYGDSVSIIDCNNKKVIKRIRGFNKPTKIIISNDNQKLFICESNLGISGKGKIIQLDRNKLSARKEINLGTTPVDLYQEEKYLYVSNFVEGTISIIDVNLFREINRINVGGMPKNIVKNKEFIIVSDYYNGVLKIINTNDFKIKNIAIGKEPDAMLLINYWSSFSNKVTISLYKLEEFSCHLWQRLTACFFEGTESFKFNNKSFPSVAVNSTMKLSSLSGK